MALALSLGRLKSVFPILEEHALPTPPAYRLSSDLRGCFLLWTLPSGYFGDLLKEAMAPIFPLRTACIGC